jgi:hypothetical protein
MGNNSKLSVSKKRKSRKQGARDLWKKQRIGSQRDSQRHENIITRDFSSSDDEVFLIEQDNNPKESFVPGGRTVVDIGHLEYLYLNGICNYFRWVQTITRYA